MDVHRFPCSSGATSCTIEWTRYDWKCLEYQNTFSGVAGLGIPQRYVVSSVAHREYTDYIQPFNKSKPLAAAILQL